MNQLEQINREDLWSPSKSCLLSTQLIYTALVQCWASADNIVSTRKQARFAPSFDECFFYFARSNSD